MSTKVSRGQLSNVWDRVWWKNRFTEISVINCSALQKCVGRQFKGEMVYKDGRLHCDRRRTAEGKQKVSDEEQRDRHLFFFALYCRLVSVATSSTREQVSMNNLVVDTDGL